jgi:hypothetical protein
MQVTGIEAYSTQLLKFAAVAAITALSVFIAVGLINRINRRRGGSDH